MNQTRFANIILVVVIVMLVGTLGYFGLVKTSDTSAPTPTTLDDYNNQFETRGFVEDPPGDFSELDLGINDAELLVIDEAGRRTGFDPATGELLEEIPQAVYYRDALEDDVTGERSPQTSSIFQIIQPPEGTYRVVVTGLKQGTFTLSVSAFSKDGSAQPELSVPVVMDVGSTSTFQIESVSSPGAVSRLKKGK